VGSLLSISALSALTVIIIGLILGQLINYLADVLPVSRRLSRPSCDRCETPYAWPTYILFKPCTTCGCRPKIRHWIVQIAVPVFAVGIWLFPPIRLGTYIGLGLIVFLGVVIVIDMEHRVILHEVSLVGAIIGLGIGIYIHGIVPTLIGGISGFGMMFLLYLLGIVFNWLMSRIRKEEISEVALGFGDVNLCGILGLILGWPGITLGLLFAILTGGVISAIYLVIMKLARKYEVFTAIPYAPFLIIGAVLLLYRPA
jgi:leader peptidase (prepilin peptidase) / N-methyltransferase